jgi:hypothetical protein
MYFKCIDNEGHNRARKTLSINSIYEGYYSQYDTVHLTITGDYGWNPTRFTDVTDRKLNRINELF